MLLKIFLSCDRAATNAHTNKYNKYKYACVGDQGMSRSVIYSGIGFSQ